MTRLAATSVSPFTGFGDDPNWAIKFGVLLINGRLPQWHAAPRRTRLRIHNSNETVTQRHGRDPWQVSWRIHLATVDDYERLDALVGEMATLRYLAGLTAMVGGAVEVIQEVPYLVLPGTLLLDLTDVTVEVGGTVEATATFERTYVAPVYPDPPPWPEPPFPAYGWPYGSGDYGDGPYGYGEPLPPEED